MKVLSIGLIGLLAAAAPFAAIAGKDASQIWQQERFAEQKRTDQMELAKLGACASKPRAESGSITTSAR